MMFLCSSVPLTAGFKIKAERETHKLLHCHSIWIQSSANPENLELIQWSGRNKAETHSKHHVISGICRASVFSALAVPLSGSMEDPGWLVILLWSGTSEIKPLSLSTCSQQKNFSWKPCSGFWNLNGVQVWQRGVMSASLCDVAVWTMVRLCGLKRQQAMSRTSVYHRLNWRRVGINRKEPPVSAFL